MSLRYFEGQDHAKVYAQHRPAPPPSLIKRVVDFLKEKYEGPLSLAVDLGCGNGQCTFALGNDFSSVLGTDISPAQISEATEWCNKLKCENVKFQTSPAEQVPTADNTVQLITICEAAHWMDLPKVYDEAKRVLCPNGVFAIIGYLLPVYIPRMEDEAKSDAIKKVVDKSIEATLDYWPKQIWSALNEYSDVTVPFSDFTRERGFPFTRTARLSDIEGCIRTYSPFQTFCREKADSVGNELLENIKKEISSILNEGRGTPMSPEELEKYEFTETFNYFVLMARI